jgi:hypothetical protein
MALPTSVIRKRVSESWPIGFKYSGEDLPSGVTIASCAVTVSPAGLTVVASGTVSGDEVSSLISGGTAATDYTVKFLTTLSNGNILQDDFLVRVVA